MKSKQKKKMCTAEICVSETDTSVTEVGILVGLVCIHSVCQ